MLLKHYIVRFYHIQSSITVNNICIINAYNTYKRYNSTLSTNIKRVVIPNKGNGLISTTQHNTHDIVLIDQPITTVVNNNVKQQICNYCINIINTEEHTCNKCNDVYYCSQQCKDNDNILHTMQCTANISKQSTTKFYQLTQQCILLYVYQITIKRNTTDNIMHKLNTLCSSNISDNIDILTNYDICIEHIIYYFNGLTTTIAQQIVPLQLYKHILSIIHLNTYALHSTLDNKYSHIGSVLFYNASYLNHSCMPNIQLIEPLTQYTREARFQAIQDININDELCISYVDTTLPYKQRQQQLQYAYGFTCQCDKCIKQI